MTRLILLSWYVVSLLLVVLLGFASGHDINKPELDEWYQSLRNQNLAFPCCSAQHCHPTEAEIRKDGWYAKVGIPIGEALSPSSWDLMNPMVMVPPTAILYKVPNRDGRPVICHETPVTYLNGERKVAPPGQVKIWCFVPPGMVRTNTQKLTYSEVPHAVASPLSLRD